MRATNVTMSNALRAQACKDNINHALSDTLPQLLNIMEDLKINSDTDFVTKRTVLVESLRNLMSSLMTVMTVDLPYVSDRLIGDLESTILTQNGEQINCEACPDNLYLPESAPGGYIRIFAYLQYLFKGIQQIDDGPTDGEIFSEIIADRIECRNVKLILTETICAAKQVIDDNQGRNIFHMSLNRTVQLTKHFTAEIIPTLNDFIDAINSNEMSVMVVESDNPTYSAATSTVIEGGHQALLDLLRTLQEAQNIFMFYFHMDPYFKVSADTVQTAVRMFVESQDTQF